MNKLRTLGMANLSLLQKQIPMISKLITSSGGKCYNEESVYFFGPCDAKMLEQNMILPKCYL